MRRPLTPGQKRKLLDAIETPEFKPSTYAVESVRDKMDIGRFTTTGWIPPPHLSDEAWLRMGVTLQEIEHATPWWWADWWLARKSRDLPPNWTGPSRRTLDNGKVVASAFPLSRRWETVEFSHYVELTSLSEAEQDLLLNWCAAAEAQFAAGKSTSRPSVRALRAEKQRRATPKLPPPKPPQSPPTPPALPSARPLKVTPPPAVRPPPEPEIEPPPPPPADITIPVTIQFPADLHEWATRQAVSKATTLDDWVLGLAQWAWSRSKWERDR